MNKYFIKKMKDEKKRTDRDRFERVESFQNTNSFVSFRYSYKSVSSSGGKTHIKARQERFENGRFESEEFEGTTDGDMCNNAVNDIQNRIFNQISNFFKPMSFFLPFAGTEDKKKKGRK
ncbi:hypothetical protein [Desulfonema magnum]|uniref:Uncharacterized protein n=1 Tax=Desulfonema magnum TaxID=45655 RepID=A0A975GSE0_9BACT|nr:hypothetical protein [Desulfonema magnum]QTA91934.1 Uncharacterized protein dnm_080070 [Desulfonema magnum]